MMEIHIYRSASFVVATTNNKRFKKNNFDNFRSKLQLVVILSLELRQKQSENREIDAIFPNLRTLHHKYCSALGLMHI